MRFADSKKNKLIEAKAECPRYQINLQRNFNLTITNLLTIKNEKL